MQISHKFNGHLEREQPQLGDLRSPWLLTTYKSWDDPPSGFLKECDVWGGGPLQRNLHDFFGANCKVSGRVLGGCPASLRISGWLRGVNLKPCMSRRALYWKVTKTITMVLGSPPCNTGLKIYSYCWWKISYTSWYACLSLYLQSSIHPRWLFGISSINSISTFDCYRLGGGMRWSSHRLPKFHQGKNHACCDGNLRGRTLPTEKNHRKQMGLLSQGSMYS